ncbi:arsenate reductase (azurin) small subunit [Rhodospirillum sp. A1_3_36]|uniref:arsenate reductase (azurin) small subunit n=1 Tax=Rhodospirillum sp. A1_3_36 TaxID=3391666 RepID=UPI0039A5627C
MKRCRTMIEVGRRQFLAGSAGMVAAAGTTMMTPSTAKASPALARVTYPSQRLANLVDLRVDEPLDITYPDADSPGVLIKLGKLALNGVGPEGDIVAFSTLCPHKGWPLAYVSGEQVLNCPGHFSRFDPEKGGLEIWGHATSNLPQVLLRVDDKGDIHAEAVDDLIHGRLSNVMS